MKELLALLVPNQVFSVQQLADAMGVGRSVVSSYIAELKRLMPDLDLQRMRDGRWMLVSDQES